MHNCAWQTTRFVENGQILLRDKQTCDEIMICNSTRIDFNKSIAWLNLGYTNLSYSLEY